MIVDLRAATANDADALAEVFLRSRKELVACAPLAHPDDDVRQWIRGRLIPTGHVTVATVDDQVVGFIAAATKDCGWIEHLYLLPVWIDRGIGTRLLEHAQRQLASPIRLHTFQANERARRFYERRGFRAIAVGDGSRNEEKCPDVLYEWRAP